MKLQQLRYLAAIVENDLNITAAAERLHTSQPGVSKQLKQLEDELGFPIFLRQGRTLTRVTPAGKRVIDRALKILKEVQSIKRLADEQKGDGRGSLSIGTTHTQARYVLPQVIRKFRERYPEVELHLHQGTSEQIADMAQRDRIDFAINTGSQELFTQPGAAALLSLAPAHRRAAGPSAGQGNEDHDRDAGASIRSSLTCSASPDRRRCSRFSRAPASRRMSRSPRAMRM